MKKHFTRKFTSLFLVMLLVVSLFGVSGTIIAEETYKATANVSRTIDQESIIFDAINQTNNHVLLTYTITPNSIPTASISGSSPKLTNVRFEEILPEGISIISLPTGMFSSGQLVYKDLSDIAYTLNASGTAYVAPSVSFQLTVSPTGPGQMVFGEDESTGLHFLNLDNSISHNFFNEVILAANAEAPAGSTELRVLEIQPARDFQLSSGSIASAFPAYTTSLTQISIPEIIGKVDELNGQYDIIYMGKTTNFTNYDFVGSYNGEDRDVEMDIDITNRRAQVLLKFIQSGQCFILDSDILNYNGSKLKANLDPIKNLSNVHLISSYSGSSFYSDMVTWYDASQKRPSLKMVSQPESFDGTDSSYLDNHTLSFIYNAFNEANGPMTANLYLDVDGNGMYVAEELVTSRNLVKSIAGLGINYRMDPDFNGGIGWKLELVEDSTGASSFQKGFVAFDGVKTTINILNLVPNNNSLILDEDGVDLDLLRSGATDYQVSDNSSLNHNTNNVLQAELNPSNDGYEINVDKMLVQNFNNSFAGSNPVILNGAYDMILFGFADSYNNKDVTNTYALQAIDDFIQTGQSVMFTHDLAGPQDYVNNTDMRTSTQSYNDYVTYNDAKTITANFKDDMGFSNERTNAGMKRWTSWTMNKAYVQNQALITMYPYQLSPNLSIASTHDQYWKIDLEGPNVVPWYNLDNSTSNNAGQDTGNIKYYPEAYYYTFSNGNVTYSGTGHSRPSGMEEQQLFVNTMFKASRGSNHKPIVTLAGVYDGMNIPPEITTIDFKLQIDDIDLNDTSFVTKFYIRHSGSSTLVETKTDMVKGELTNISIAKNFDETVTDFTLKVVVEDMHGADGTAENDYTQLNVPTLDMTDVDLGYLVGDVFVVNYEFLATKVADEGLISNIDLDATINSTFLETLTYSNFTKVADVYNTTPAFDDPTTTSVDESDKIRATQLRAIAAGQPNVQVRGTYDVKYNLTDVTTVEQNFREDALIGIREGDITIQIQDDLSRPVTNVLVSIKDSSGTEVPYVGDKKTDATGQFIISDLVTDTYDVTITVPPNYAQTDGVTRSIALSYTNHQPTVNFELADKTPPEVTYKYNPALLDTSLGAVVLPIHVKLDGVNSKLLTNYDIKEVPDGTTLNENDVAGFNALPDDPDGSGPLTPYDFPAESDADSPLDYDPLSPADYEQLVKFNVTHNGFYAVYAKNEAGNEVVKIIQIINIIDSIYNLL